MKMAFMGDANTVNNFFNVFFHKLGNMEGKFRSVL